MRRGGAAGAGLVLLAALLSPAGGARAAAPQAAAPAYPKSVRPGDLFVLRLPAGAPAPTAALFLGTTYPPLKLAGEPGTFFLLGSDLDAAPGSEQIVVRRGASEERLALTLAKRSFPEERLTLPPAMVTPPQQFEERIAREQALTAAIYRSSTPEQLWERGFSRALSQKPAGNFGRRRILNGTPKSPHGGEDYTAPSGTPVLAVAAGRVRLAQDLYYSGLTVLVDHGAGLVSQYLHLEKLLVREGARVAAGETVGLVGSTGRATGPHLHLGLRLFGLRVDPESLWGLFPAAKAAPP